jgi:hypothetical protein
VSHTQAGVGPRTYLAARRCPIASSGIAYGEGVLLVLTKLAGKFAQAFADASGVVTILWAVDTLAEAVGDLVTQSLDILLLIGQRLIDALGNVRDLMSQANDFSKFELRSWPEAVAG